MNEPVFEKVNFCVEKEKIVDKIKAECKTELLSESVKKPLCVFARVFGISKEVKDLKVQYGGKIVFYFFFVNADGEVKKLECVNEFVGVSTLPQGFENSEIKIKIDVSKAECDLTKVNATLSASLLVEILASQKESCLALSSGEDLVSKTCEICSFKSFGERSGCYPVEEEFGINFAVKEVLSQKAEVVITDVQCGAMSIIVDGEIYLSCLLLQKIEKSDIIREEKRLPFRIEIEHEDALPSAIATAFARIKNLSTDIQVDEENGKSTVRVSILLDLTGEVLIEEEKTVVEDAFSKSKHITLEKVENAFYSPEKLAVKNGTVKCKASVENLPVGARIMAVGSERAEVVSYSIKENSIQIEGVLSMSVYLKDLEGGLYSYNLEGPFEISLDGVFEFDNLQIELTPYLSSARILSMTEIELESQITFSLKGKTLKKISVISGIKEGEEKALSDKAISVYIPLENESLWCLSKRLGVCPSELLETNKELQFPLTGKERIVIYRQK